MKYFSWLINIPVGIFGFILSYTTYIPQWASFLGGVCLGLGIFSLSDYIFIEKEWGRQRINGN